MVRFLDKPKGEIVYCANCAHCIKFPWRNENYTQHVFRVRCEKDQWLSKLYRFHTVLHRIIEKDSCEYYEPFDEPCYHPYTKKPETYKKNLTRNVPTRDFVYELVYMKPAELDAYRADGLNGKAHHHRWSNSGETRA